MVEKIVIHNLTSKYYQVQYVIGNNSQGLQQLNINDNDVEISLELWAYLKSHPVITKLLKDKSITIERVQE